MSTLWKVLPMKPISTPPRNTGFIMVMSLRCPVP